MYHPCDLIRHLPKAPPPNTHTMGNRFQCPNLAGNTNLPSVARFKKFEWGLDLLGSNAGFITDYYHVTLDE